MTEMAISPLRRRMIEDMTVLRRTHDRHRDLRARRNATLPPDDTDHRHIMRRTNQSRPNELAVLLAGSLPATTPFAQNAEFGQTLRPYDSIDQRARCQYRHASRKEPNQRPATAFRSRSNAITAAVKSP